MALLYPDKVKSSKERQEIAQLVQGYNSPTDYFVQRLSEGVGMIAAAFYPKPVVVRMSDFKSNEYPSLLGGNAYNKFHTRQTYPIIR
jgi:pyruvate,water dikinase